MKETKDKAILTILEEIQATSNTLRKTNSRYQDGSGPRLSYEEEKRAMLELIAVLCKAVTQICNEY